MAIHGNTPHGYDEHSFAVEVNKLITRFPGFLFVFGRSTFQDAVCVQISLTIYDVIMVNVRKLLSSTFWMV